MAGATDAVLGLADDGGFWLLGLRQPDPGLVLGVPMSVPSTGAEQLLRLRQAGMRVRRLRSCTDVDTAADAFAVAAAIPASRFTAALSAMLPNLREHSPADPTAGPYGFVTRRRGEV